MTEKTGIGDKTDITISLRWLIQLIVIAILGVIGYFQIVQRIVLLERDMYLVKENVEQNKEFRIKWPRGELGALPDDVEQNIRLDHLERSLRNTGKAKTK